jgi:hypothetical protein
MVKLLNFNGSSCNRLARLNADGSLDTSFLLVLVLIKRLCVSSSVNKLIIGGIFLNYRNAAAKRIVRLHTNGTLDTSFTMGRA